MNMRLEEVIFGELIPLNCGADIKKQPLKGIKRQEKLHITKLDDSLKTNGWVFPIFVAEIPEIDPKTEKNKRYLIDGYARWKREDSQQLTQAGFGLKKYPALIFQARDYRHVIELYLQCQSNYGSANHVDLRSLLLPLIREEYKNDPENDPNTIPTQLERGDYTRWEIPGIVHPNFDLSVMTREEIAKLALQSKYQII